MTTEPTASESARHLLDRHGLPEDVVDGALCLHAQELAAVQRREAAVWGVDTAAGKHILGAADLIDPTRAAAVPVPPSAGIDRRAQLLDALDFAYCQGLGFDTPEALLAAYDVSRGVPVPPPADQTALLRAHVALAEQAGRDQAALARVRRLRDALDAETALTSPDDEITRSAAARKIAAALDGWTAPAPTVLAVLPEPTDRGAVLREAADAIDRKDAEQGYPEDGVGWATAELRRMAAEEQPAKPDRCPHGCDTSICPCLACEAAEEQAAETQAHPPEHTWGAELHDPLADEWVPGTRYLVRERAVKHLAHARSVGPTWKDGTPTQRRLVRATTTYTVEAEHTPPTARPAVGEQPETPHLGGNAEDCPACRGTNPPYPFLCPGPDAP